MDCHLPIPDRRVYELDQRLEGLESVIEDLLGGRGLDEFNQGVIKVQRDNFLQINLFLFHLSDELFHKINYLCLDLDVPLVLF